MARGGCGLNPGGNAGGRCIWACASSGVLRRRRDAAHQGAARQPVVGLGHGSLPKEIIVLVRKKAPA